MAANTTSDVTKKRESPLDNGFGLWFFCFSSGQLLPVCSAATVKLRPRIATAANLNWITDQESAVVDQFQWISQALRLFMAHSNFINDSWILIKLNNFQLNYYFQSPRYFFSITKLSIRLSLFPIFHSFLFIILSFILTYR